MSSPVCSTCNDTHMMSLGERDVMCTRCPIPCDICRGIRGAFCEFTPCDCACHRGGMDSRIARPVAAYVWLVITHGHSIRGIWTDEDKAREHARSFPQILDFDPQLVRVMTDVRL